MHCIVWTIFWLSCITTLPHIYGAAFIPPDDYKIDLQDNPRDLGEGYNDITTGNGNDEDFDDISLPTDREIEILSDVLVGMLQTPSNRPLPLFYIEEPTLDVKKSNMDTFNRSQRYYRRYPWKRQNSRPRPYNPENRYLCNPSREDVFKLLVALHETRRGGSGGTINFCNRPRPTGKIFTNIRFLGRRK